MTVILSLFSKDSTFQQLDQLSRHNPAIIEAGMNESEILPKFEKFKVVYDLSIN